MMKKIGANLIFASCRTPQILPLETAREHFKAGERENNTSLICFPRCFLSSQQRLGQEGVS